MNTRILVVHRSVLLTVLLGTILSLGFTTAVSAESSSSDPLPVPEGWRGEEMEMPPPFAPSLSYQGRLFVRFSPTWQDFDAADGWAYAFVWRIAPTNVDAARLESDLEVYFDGLMQAVGAERHAGKHVPAAAEFRAAKAEAPWRRRWEGTVRSWDAFSSGGPLTLNFEVREMMCQGGEQKALLFLVAKARPGTSVWEQLYALVPKASC